VPDWKELIAAQDPSDPLEARNYYGPVSSSASSPQRFGCGEDDQLYAIEFRNNAHGDGRALVAEHLAGRCGSLLGAPVAEIAVISVSNDLVRDGLVVLAGDGRQAESGLQHGSRWVQPFGDRKGIEYIEENRTRLGALQVLYSWLLCTADHQLLYRDEPPHDVLSVDHSEMLPGAVGGWTPAALSAESDNVVLDAFFDPAGLGESDREAAAQALERASEEDIAASVAGPPAEWGLDETDRIALAQYLVSRRGRLLEVLA
jgi:hypothetical protein